MIYREVKKMKCIDTIKEIMDSISEDVGKLEVKGIKSAAPRIRKALMEISRACKEGRKEVQEIKNKGSISEPQDSESDNPVSDME
jgi:archaellum component FlaC